MNLFNKIKSVNKTDPSPPGRVRLTKKNIQYWPKFFNLMNEGKIKFDRNERLRYLHGAPVGDLVLARVNKGETPNYKESAEEWFDPESEKAKNFNWND